MVYGPSGGSGFRAPRLSNKPGLNPAINGSDGAHAAPGSPKPMMSRSGSPCPKVSQLRSIEPALIFAISKNPFALLRIRSLNHVILEFSKGSQHPGATRGTYNRGPSRRGSG